MVREGDPVWHTVQSIGSELEGKLLSGRSALRQPRPEKSVCAHVQAVEEASARSSLDVAESKIRKSEESGAALILCFRTPFGSVKLDNLWPTTPVSEVLQRLRDKLGDQTDKLWWSVGPKPFNPDLLLSDYNVQSGLTVLGMLRVLGGSGPLLQREQLQKALQEAFQELKLVRVSVKDISGKPGLYECCWPCAGEGSKICEDLFHNTCESTSGCIHMWSTNMTGGGPTHRYTMVRPPQPPLGYSRAPKVPTPQEVQEAAPLWWIKHREDELWDAWEKEESKVVRQEQFAHLRAKRIERLHRLYKRLTDSKDVTTSVTVRSSRKEQLLQERTLKSLAEYAPCVPCPCDAGNHTVRWVICGHSHRNFFGCGDCQSCGRSVVSCNGRARFQKTSHQGLHCSAHDHVLHYLCWSCAIEKLDLDELGKVKPEDMKPNKDDKDYEAHLDEEEAELAQQMKQERRTVQKQKMRAVDVTESWLPAYAKNHLKVYEAWVVECLQRSDEWDRYYNLQEHVQDRFSKCAGFLQPCQRPWFPEVDLDLRDVGNHPLWKHLNEEDRERFESLNLRLREVGHSERCKRAKEVALPQTPPPAKASGRRFSKQYSKAARPGHDP